VRPLWGRFVFHNAAACTVLRTFPIEVSDSSVAYFPTPGELPVALREKTTKDTDGRRAKYSKRETGISMNTSMRRTAWLACASLWLAGVVGSLPAAAASYDVAAVSYPGSDWTLAMGTNEQGMVVGTALYFGGPSAAFVYNPRNDTFVPLPTESGYQTWGIGINDAGVVVGHIEDLDTGHADAFVYDKGVMTRLSFPGAVYTEARGINNRGIVAGNAQLESLEGPWIGLVYDPAKNEAVTFMPSDVETIVQGINDRGDVVGSVWLRGGAVPSGGSGNGFYGFVRDARGVVTLFRINEDHTVVRGISSYGRITGWAGLSTDPRGFIIDAPTGGGFKDLTIADEDLYPGFQGQGITNKGAVVGNVWLDEGGPDPALRGFIATPIH